MNQALIDNLTVEEKIRYGYVPDDVATAALFGDAATDAFDNFNIDTGDVTSDVLITGIESLVDNEANAVKAIVKEALDRMLAILDGEELDMTGLLEYEIKELLESMQ